MSTFNALGSAMYAKLTGATALTTNLTHGTAVYHMQAPDATPFPFVVYSLQAGGPLNITPSDMRDMIYYVRGYAKNSLTAGTIDAEISNLLHHGTLSVSGYTTYRIDRETDVYLIDNLPSGERVYTAGATYRVSIDIA